MNVENFNLTELNAQEKKSIEGGNPIVVGVAIAAGVYAVYAGICEVSYRIGYFIGRNT